MTIEDDKIIKRIISLQKDLFIPYHVDEVSELKKKNHEELSRYARACEILHGSQATYNKKYISCTLCKKYMSDLEIKNGSECLECLRDIVAYR